MASWSEDQLYDLLRKRGIPEGNDRMSGVGPDGVAGLPANMNEGRRMYDDRARDI